MCTDGPFTLACNLRGVDDFCVDMYEDPDYAHQLLAYITAATIERLKVWRRYLRQDEIQPSFFFADDSVALLSADMYREWIYPYHKQLIDALSTDDARNGIHLCGDASRHFRFLKEMCIRDSNWGLQIVPSPALKAGMKYTFAAKIKTVDFKNNGAAWQFWAQQAGAGNKAVSYTHLFINIPGAEHCFPFF